MERVRDLQVAAEPRAQGGTHEPHGHRETGNQGGGPDREPGRWGCLRKVVSLRRWEAEHMGRAVSARQ